LPMDEDHEVVSVANGFHDRAPGTPMFRVSIPGRALPIWRRSARPAQTGRCWLAAMSPRSAAVRTASCACASTRSDSRPRQSPAAQLVRLSGR
jgi:hypothetical protein